MSPAVWHRGDFDPRNVWFVGSISEPATGYTEDRVTQISAAKGFGGERSLRVLSLCSCDLYLGLDFRSGFGVPMLSFGDRGVQAEIPGDTGTGFGRWSPA